MATTSHAKNGFAEEIRQIQNTPGFHVDDLGDKWKAINDETGVSYPIHRGVGRGASYRRDVLKGLRDSIGWTPGLYEEAQAAKRGERVAEHKRMEHRVNSFIEGLTSPLEGQPQMQSTEEATETTEDTRGTGIATVIDVNKDPIDIELEVPTALGGCSLRFEWITAETAQDYLDSIIDEDAQGRMGQRPVSVGDVIEWSRRIREGHFRFVPDPVLFDEEGALFNGQHRLRGFLAAVKSGYTHDIPMLVGRNWPRDLFMYVDHGRKRTTAQTLAIMNEKNTAQLAATVKQVHCLLDVKNQEAWSKVKMIDQEVIAFLKAHPEIRRSHKLTGQARDLGFNRTAYCSAHYFLTVEVGDSRPVDEFFNQLFEGTGLKKGDPVYALREFMLRGDDRRVTANIRKVPKGKLHLYYLIQAWNNTQKGAYVTIPSYRSPGTINKPLPYVPPNERPQGAIPED